MTPLMMNKYACEFRSIKSIQTNLGSSIFTEIVECTEGSGCTGWKLIKESLVNLSQNHQGENTLALYPVTFKDNL